MSDKFVAEDIEALAQSEDESETVLVAAPREAPSSPGDGSLSLKGSPARRALENALMQRVNAYIRIYAVSVANEKLEIALSEPSPVGTIVRVLQDFPFEFPALDESDHRIAAAIARGVALKARLLERAGGYYSSTQLGKILGITPQAVADGRSSRYFGVPTSGNKFAYPKLQLTDTGLILPGLRDFLHAFVDADEWTQLVVLMDPSPRLGGRSPLDAIRRGDIDGAKAVAAAYGNHGA